MQDLMSDPDFQRMTEQQRIAAVNEVMARQFRNPPLQVSQIHRQEDERFPGYDLLTALSKRRDTSLIVHVLGAGPVGLLTAIKLVDLYKQQVNVVLFEKRESYTRERILFVNRHIIHTVLPKQFMTRGRMAQYGCSLNNLPNNDLASCNVSPNLQGIDRLAISTRVLEDDLKNLLASNEYNSQVHFVYNSNSDKAYIEEVNARFTPHVLIGADGGNLSTTLYPEQKPDGPIVKNSYVMHDNNGTVGRPIRTTYGLIIQFIPDYSDTKFKPGSLAKRQNRYRVFRQQFRYYQKCESGDCINEPLLYYIAVQLNKAERDQIVKELGGKEWSSEYKLGDNGPHGKYLDRLIYDASQIYNFNLFPGRSMRGISVFALNVSSMSPENYSRVVKVKSFDGTMKQMWFPLIGDSILTVNFFSGTGVNAGFAMIDILLQSLVQLLPNRRASFLFKEGDPLKLAVFSPEIVKRMDQEERNRVMGIGHLKMPTSLIGTLQDDFDSHLLSYFNGPTSSNLQKMVQAYRTGLDLDLQAGSIMTQEYPGMERILSTNIFGSYLDYNTMIKTCNNDPSRLNELKQASVDKGISLQEIDLKYLDNNGDPMETERLFPKAIDRFCLMSHNTFTQN